MNFILKIINRLANSLDSDDTAHDEPSNLDLHGLHKYLYRSAVLKELNEPKRERTYLPVYGSNENSNRTVHPHSLIRVFVVCRKKLCILSYPIFDQ